MKEGFSVSMCVYHGDDAACFQTAVESVLTQTCLPEEIVLVVDGPVPKALEEVISEYEKNPLFRVLRLEKTAVTALQGGLDWRLAGVSWLP